MSHCVILKSKHDLNFTINSCEDIPLPTNILMVKPKYFNIGIPINAHMLDEHGHTHELDFEKAQLQWKNLKIVYESLNFNVSVIQGVEGLPDMVFCANQSFPYLGKNGELCAILSNMKNDTRHKEVSSIEKFLKSQNFQTHYLANRNEQSLFEGMGDASWLCRKKFILGGYGFRTSELMYQKLLEKTQCPIAIFELKNPKFYHLDTCLSVLNSTTALVCKSAFTTEGYDLLKSIIPNLIEVPLEEADSPGFACNAHCPDESHVIIQRGNTKTLALLQSNKFIPIEVDTSEFIKSGGSVYCMKLSY